MSLIESIRDVALTETTSSALSTQHSALSTQHSALSTQHSALITGANKGIGLAIARQLGVNGHSVWLGCRDISRGAAAAGELRREGINARAVQLDVADGASVANAVKTIGNDIGVLDVLVNNAGLMFGPPPSLAEESLDEIKQMFETNVFGILRVTQAFLP